jgi:uncharacterized oligopeptide transporter (OPT) family protein
MIIFRATLAAVLGALIALGIYLAWFFAITHHDHPWDGETLGFMVLTAFIAAICGLIGGYIGALSAPITPRGATDAMAALIAIVAVFADRHTPGQHHWAQLIALFVTAPAAYAAGRLRKPIPRPA